MRQVEDLSQRTGLRRACEVLGVARATVYRHRRPTPIKAPRRPHRPPRALCLVEQEEVLAVLHSERFVDQAPATVVATLMDEGRYLCSARTMYRLLTQHLEVRERRPPATVYINPPKELPPTQSSETDAH